ncbi:hypothetical protein, membrane [gut metagenome]|uniref:Uncharacterized protein n=1 Tax=gut metagenome TaxID=749906 RepID=J9GG45_9ZZZZ
MKQRQLIGIFLFILFAAYWCGINCFTHSHVENGVIVVHSHPFQDTGHGHTPQQYETIFFLTHILSLEGATYTFDGSEPYVLWVVPFIVLPSVLIATRGERLISLRAPPYSVA